MEDTNRLPHSSFTIQQENSCSPSLITGSLSSLLQGTGSRLGEYCKLMPWFHPPSLLLVLWLPPPSSTSYTHVLGHPHPCPGKCSDHPVCGDGGQCPGLVQSQSLKGGWSQLSSRRMSQGKAWALLSRGTRASLLSKAGERFKTNYSTDNCQSHFNFPVEIMQWISLPISSRSATKPQSPFTLIRDSIRDLWLWENNWKPLITKSSRKTRKQSLITFLSE